MRFVKGFLQNNARLNARVSANSENKEYDLNVTHGEQINYVFITLKELIIIQWEYIRENRLWVTK